MKKTLIRFGTPNGSARTGGGADCSGSVCYRPENPFEYPQCTRGAEELFHKYTGKYIITWGNAAEWAEEASSVGWCTTTNPVPNAIVVFRPGVDEAHPYYGHVALVDPVNCNGTVTITERPTSTIRTQPK